MTGDHQRPRTVAFYLPQFHQIPENDEWWGEGFTEWTNVRPATPVFDGHDQPRVPTADLGYYDLSDPSTLHRQAALAAENGVDGFCIYFYWFAGRRLLESPLDAYLEKGPEFPFCLSWANENWTRRWDGKDHEVLIGQDYGPESPADVFKAMLPYLRDRRYIRVDDGAVLVVHRADHLPDPKAFADSWRLLAVQEGVGPLHLVAAETVPGLDPRDLGFDATAEFPPVGSATASVAFLTPLRGLRSTFRGRLLSYERLARQFERRSREERFIRYHGVMPGWDNSARRRMNATIFLGSSPARYARWLAAARDREAALRGANGLVFINAWNEWAEGAYLEPDTRWDTGYLRATAGVSWNELPGAPSIPRGLLRWAHVRATTLAALASGVATLRRLRRFLRRFLRRPAARR